tara:strand:+ start:1616 stop:1921 length:306 start_codon:yes stop_codon:yes gene_type:complete
MPKEIALPVPLDRWFNDVKKIEELRIVLDSAAFQTASATLKEVAGPTYSSVSADATSNSNRLSWYAGYRDAFNDLYKLTRIQGNKPNPHQTEEWTHIQNPQ